MKKLLIIIIMQMSFLYGVDRTLNNINDLKNVRYVDSFRQRDSFSCGYWALFNAKTIQDCVDLDKKIIGDIILIKAPALKSNITGDKWLWDDEIDQKALLLGVKNYSILGKATSFYSNDIVPFHLNFNYLEQFGLEKSKNFYFRKLKNEFINKYVEPNKSGALYFIVNTGGHWVLIALVKIKNEQPEFLVLDSLSNGISREANRILRMLYTKFFSVFYR